MTYGSTTPLPPPPRARPLETVSACAPNHTFHTCSSFSLPPPNSRHNDSFFFSLFLPPPPIPPDFLPTLLLKVSRDLAFSLCYSFPSSPSFLWVPKGGLC